MFDLNIFLQNCNQEANLIKTLVPDRLHLKFYVLISAPLLTKLKEEVKMHYSGYNHYQEMLDIFKDDCQFAGFDLIQVSDCKFSDIKDKNHHYKLMVTIEE